MRIRPVVLAAAAGVGVAVTIGGWLGPPLGFAVGLGAHRWLARQPSRESLARDRAIAADLPYAADLLAAALRSGAAPDVAARCVGLAIGGPLGARLALVDRSLRLGAPAAEAWGYLGADQGAARLAQAAVRSQHSGAAFAGSLLRVAEDLRADQLIAADAAARRAGVLIVLPLGLCFLPSFVLAGLVPVIVSVLSGVLSR